MIKFILITNEPELASYANTCGVGRVLVDLEQLGKQERQGHLDTLISQHTMDDVIRVKKQLNQADLLVRLNPLNSASVDEINQAIAGGADQLMLPMFYCPDEVREFSKMVNGRVGVTPLVETYDAANAIADIVKVPGVTEIYIGLNDLHLDMKLKFMFEPLAMGFVDKIVGVVKEASLPFGFGGIARVGEGIIPGEMVLGEHQRLGSNSVILSRTFHRLSESVSEIKANLDLREELNKLRVEERKLKGRSEKEIEIDRSRFVDAVTSFVTEQRS